MHRRLSDFDATAFYRDLPKAGDTPIHVGIVGAGFSGLRCAEVLLGLGHRVTILEARDRIGGRVSSLNNHQQYTRSI